jgi:hypothetical protein
MTKTAPFENSDVIDNDTRAAAERAFNDFLLQVQYKDPKGLLSTGNGKIFSFEKFLRDNSFRESVIVAYCNHVKSTNYFEPAAKSMRVKWVIFKSYLKLVAIMAVAACVLYLLFATLLLLFSISWWNMKTFLEMVGGFTITGTVVALYKLFKDYATRKKEDRKPNPNALFIIKYFDNDELTFARSKSRLFREQ